MKINNCSFDDNIKLSTGNICTDLEDVNALYMCMKTCIVKTGGDWVRRMTLETFHNLVNSGKLRKIERYHGGKEVRI